MRVAIAGLHHETNTFSPVGADLAAFEAAGILRGDELVDAFTASNHTVSGFLRACRDERATVVPLLYANVSPCGTIGADAFEALTGELVAELHGQGPFDVVLLAQHGAAVTAEHSDADGELLRRVRAAVGPRVAVGLALDLHANVTDRMVDAADVVVGYRENPHRDPAERAAECARLAFAVHRGDPAPVHRLLRLGMVVPILGGWTEGPMRDVMEEAADIARRHALLSHTVFHGFGYTDVPEMGASVLAVATEAEAAEQAAHELAAALWERREALRGDAETPAGAVEIAGARPAGTGPTVILDVGDNVGGGSPGDSTVLLAAALERDLPGLVVPICDAEAVLVALAAGEGAEVEVTVGQTTAVSAGPPVTVRGQVSRVTDGRFEDPNPTHGGFRFHDGGPTVRVTTTAGQELVISSRAVPSWSPEQLRAVGIEPRDARVIVAKGVVAPRAGYEPVAGAFVLADTPGITAADLSRLPYRSRPRPLWPLEPDAPLYATNERARDDA